MEDASIVKLEWGVLEGRRPRNAGSNARLGEHGITVRVPILRVTDSDGVSGFGACHVSEETATALLGKPLHELVTDEGVGEAFLRVEYPLLDLIGKKAGQPVYELAAQWAGKTVTQPLRVPCYDTSLYFDDLHLDATETAAWLIAEEAVAGYEAGHRAFKIKVGRGARHLPLEEGTLRDIAIILAVREAVGKNVPLMIDANNGYNLNLAKRVLEATAECGIYWLEEAFHEDATLYRDLKGWMKERGIATLIADGEGQASPTLLDWARDGLVDVIQYDIFGYGFTRWLKTGRQLDGWNVKTAPHHYGGHYGNYAAPHLAGAIDGFSYVEWDEATTPGLDGSAYRIEEGFVALPVAPGFGLELEEPIFRNAVENGGFIHAL